MTKFMLKCGKRNICIKPAPIEITAEDTTITRRKQKNPEKKTPHKTYLFFAPFKT